MKPLALGLATVTVLLAAHNSTAPAECGTDRSLRPVERFLHHQSRLQRFLQAGGSLHSLAMPSAANNSDVNGIAIIDDADGVVSHRNSFSLSGQTLRFTPTPDGFQRLDTPSDAPYQAPTPDALPLTGLGDDDARPVDLPFPFPFFGNTYSSVFVNSDGNLTFTSSDTASSDRSVARFNAGPPRIAPLFSDLDPSRTGAAVIVQASDTSVIFTWNSVPVYTSFGVGARQTFQVRLFPDGAIEFAYASIAISGSTAVVGIAPGRLSQATELLPLRGSAGFIATGGIGEFFSDLDQLDLAAAAQKFYSTHEDSYDYIFVFNAIHLSINNGATVAFEDTVRNSVQGYGVGPLDDGLIFGSPRRLQAAMNMGPIEQYPFDPFAPIPARGTTGDTGLSILGHEAGHRFLAWTSVKDDSGTPVMWGNANVHWSFNFNSDASLDEGNRIADNGAGVKPRFQTVATVQGFSALDQYLFGWRAPEDVPALFAVINSDGPSNIAPPHVGNSFNGQRYDISIQDVIAEAGVRIPDSSVAQRNFRFAFVVVQSASNPLSSIQLGLAATYRDQWVSYWNRVTAGQSTADVNPARALAVSFWPNAELASGRALDASISITAPLDHDLTIFVDTPAGVVTAPASVILKAGETTVGLPLQGTRSGVEEITLRPEDGAFEVVQARIRVNP